MSANLKLNLSVPEFGAATIVMLAKLKTARTQKQLQADWNRIAFFLKKQLEILQPQHRNELKTARLLAIDKRYEPDADVFYITSWELAAVKEEI